MPKSKESFNKKETEKKKKKQRNDKREKMMERKANAKKSTRLEDMMAYIDENGNLSSTPPDPRKKKMIDHADIQLGVPKREKEEIAELNGTLTFFDTAKGYGFISEQQSKQSIF